MPGLLLSVNGVALGGIVMSQDFFQARYTPPRSFVVTHQTRIGELVDEKLSDPITSLPATVVLFPECSSCSIYDPAQLADLPINHPVWVLVPNASSADLAKWNRLGGKARYRSVASACAAKYGETAAPKVLQLDANRRLSFMQESFVPLAELARVINDH
jgi:hypothetical protein